MSDDGEVEYGLVMPFVAVASKGGPFDDDAYVAGYEMGLLAARLDREHVLEPEIETTIRTDNVGQADLLAMRYGWKLESRPDAIYGDEWTHVRLTQSDGEADG